jgi:hypothetical protein
MEEQKKFDPAVAEREFQSRVVNIKNALARYTTQADMGNFFERNKSAIEGLARDKGSCVSEVMTGFRAIAKPDKTYDARVELQFYMAESGKFAFKPRLHFKQKELIISKNITLPTLAREEYSFSLNECRQNKLEATVAVGGENVKVALTEADLTELSSTRQLSRVLQGDSGRYDYSLYAGPDSLTGKMDRLVISQREKIQLPDEDIQQLQQTGHLDKFLKVGEGINERRYFVAVDKALNKLAFTPASTFAFLDRVKVVSLTQPERLALLNGKEVATTLMHGQDAGAKVKVRLNPVKKNLKIEMAEAPHQAQKVAQKAAMSSSLKAVQAQVAAEKVTPVKRQKMGV